MIKLRSFLLLLMAMPAFGGLVVNGAFNNNCANWTVTLTVGPTCSSTDGNPGFALILNNVANVVPQATQTIAGLQIGDLYQITIDGKTSFNCCNDPSVPGAGVGIDGKQFDFLIVNNQPWKTYTFNFTYGGGSPVFVISAQRNGTDSDGEFDNVDINLIGTPEPAGLVLIGTGMALILAARRWRRA
jgi:hypothetical protein